MKKQGVKTVMFDKLKKKLENTAERIGRKVVDVEQTITDVLKGARTQEISEDVVKTVDAVSKAVQQGHNKAQEEQSTDQEGASSKASEFEEALSQALGVVLPGGEQQNTADTSQVTTETVNQYIRQMTLEGHLGNQAQVKSLQQDILDAVKNGQVDVTYVNIEPVLNGLLTENTLGGSDTVENTAQWILDMIDAGLPAKNISMRGVMSSITTAYILDGNATAGVMEKFLLEMVEKGARTDDLSLGLRGLKTAIDIERSFANQTQAYGIEILYNEIQDIIARQQDENVATHMLPSEKMEHEVSHLKEKAQEAFSHHKTADQHSVHSGQIKAYNQKVRNNMKRPVLRQQRTGIYKR